MNFTPFGVPFSGSLPITQFTANGKMTTQSLGGQVVGVLQGGEGGVHYLRPVDTSGTSGNNAGIPQTLITLPITMPGAKPGDPQQTVQIQVIAGQPQPKYQVAQLPIQAFQQPGGGTVLTVAYNGGQQDGVLLTDGTQGLPEGVTVVAALQPHDLQLLSGATLQAAPSQSEGDDGEKTDDSSKQEGPQPVALVKADLIKTEMSQEPEQQYVTGIADYLSRVQTNSLPLSLNQFLKFNPETIKRESQIESSPLSSGGADGSIGDESNSLVVNMEQEGEQVNADGTTKKKKKYKKKPPKPKKPKPGQVHIATALDGTTLFCCPECNMAYPEKDLLEQHLVGHKIERRFICDICGAGLKRKEHLERHKLGHNPERPFICSVCMKGFKRKEHLNLHFVIHSGEKTEVCGECGKGFYRKDHLRKHARSHVARRVKEELSQQVQQAAAMAQAVQAAQQSQAQGQTQTQHLTIQVSNEAMEAMGLSASNVPTTQIQVPVQIQVPQHLVANSISNTINNTISSALNSPMNTPNGNGSNMSDSTNDEQTDQQHQVSTVVLPTAAETGAMALLHQQQTNAHH